MLIHLRIIFIYSYTSFCLGRGGGLGGLFFEEDGCIATYDLMGKYKLEMIVFTAVACFRNLLCFGGVSYMTSQSTEVVVRVLQLFDGQTAEIACIATVL